MIGGAGSRHRRRRSSPGVHFAQAQQVARLAALNRAELNGADGELASELAGAELGQALARRRSSKYWLISLASRVWWCESRKLSAPLSCRI